MCGEVDIPQAKTYEEAMKIFNETSDYIELPEKGKYVDGSFELSTEDPDEMKGMMTFEDYHFLRHAVLLM